MINCRSTKPLKNFLAAISQTAASFFRWSKYLFLKWISRYWQKSNSLAAPPIGGELYQARREYYWAQNCFNNATDSYQLDYAIYQMLAAESNYRYLLNLLRAQRAALSNNHSPGSNQPDC